MRRDQARRMERMYQAVRIAAEAEGQTITAYCCAAILARAMSEPEIPDVATLPAWLLHVLLFLTRRKTRGKTRGKTRPL